jgi:hypothetical protein
MRRRTNAQNSPKSQERTRKEKELEKKEKKEKDKKGSPKKPTFAPSVTLSTAHSHPRYQTQSPAPSSTKPH